MRARVERRDRIPSPVAGVRAAFLALCAAVLTAGAAQAQNPVVTENTLPGNPASEWDVSGAGDPSIQGFATRMSVDRGGTIGFKIDTDATDYRLDIYRLGYYGGMGARRVATVQPTAALPQLQPDCLSDETTGLVDCGNWAVSAAWSVPATATSGIYIAKLVREDPEDGRASHVVFVVRDDDGGSELLFQTSDATWQAYNTYGGNSLYAGLPVGRAYKVSYNRPFTTRCCEYPAGSIRSWLFDAEYPMLRWLERNGYDVSYTTGIDTARRGEELLEHRLFLAVGHDEYWSAEQRANVEAARDAGVHLAFLSGNQGFWKTRWEPSIDGSGTPDRTLVCYKETNANAKVDPLPGVWTGTWRDPRFGPHDGGRPENALNGSLFTVNGIRNDTPEVPAADGKMRFWRNTSIASLAPGEVAVLPEGVLGFEWDEELDNGSAPAGLVRLSTTTVPGVQVLQDFGTTYATGTATHHVTLYRHASGALVFGAGTVQWSWGLDEVHDYAGTPVDPRMQQATVNLFADMGVQPGTLQGDLVPAEASTDTDPPSAAITVPENGGAAVSGTPLTIAGTASDVGGEVGGVEVSTDGGATWHRAQGRSAWTYVWLPDVVGPVTVRARAVDDSGNLGAVSPGVSVTVSQSACPCSIWPDNAAPSRPSVADTEAVELGVRFRSDVAGVVSAIRFYKGPGNTGPHTGRLWTDSGTLLGTVTFTDETDTSWQTAAFASPISIAADTTYVASYHTTVGRYERTPDAFVVAGVDRPPLHAVRDAAGARNGVFQYGDGGVFPTGSFSANYWVDVVFDGDGDGDGHAAATDCDDANPSVHPGAPEVCNGIDDDCDTVIDGPAAAAACDDGLFCTGVETCSTGACVSPGDPCAGGPACRDVCNETTDSCFAPAGNACPDDGAACTADACDGAGTCVHAPIPDCGTTSTTTPIPTTSTTTTSSSTTATSSTSTTPTITESTTTTSTTSTTTASNTTTTFTTTSTTPPTDPTTTTTLPGCAPAPVDDCQPSAATKGLLVLRDARADSRDQLRWKWVSRDPVVLAELGSPLTSSDYDVCLYTGGSLALGGLVPQGGACGGKACWKTTRAGFSYANRKLTADGVSRIVLKAGTVGKISLRGRGGKLRLPAMPLATPVRVQMRRRDGGTCWESRITQPAVNTAGRFRGRSE